MVFNLAPGTFSCTSEHPIGAGLIRPSFGSLSTTRHRRRHSVPVAHPACPAGCRGRCFLIRAAESVDAVHVISARGSSLTSSIGFLQWGHRKCTGGSEWNGAIVNDAGVRGKLHYLRIVGAILRPIHQLQSSNFSGRCRSCVHAPTRARASGQVRCKQRPANRLTQEGLVLSPVDQADADGSQERPRLLPTQSQTPWVPSLGPRSWQKSKPEIPIRSPCSSPNNWRPG